MGSIITDCLNPKENSQYSIITYKILPRRPKDNQTPNSSKGFYNSDKPKNIDYIPPIDLIDDIREILRVRVPFFNAKPLQSLSVVSFVTGNGLYHEGLIITTKNKKIYVTQIYPITFIKVNNIYEAITEIMSFNNFNILSREYYISDIYIPNEYISLGDIYQIVNNYPNKYSMLTDNCQTFCENIILNLSEHFNINKTSKPEITKFRYQKMKQELSHKIDGYVKKKIHINFNNIKMDKNYNTKKNNHSFDSAQSKRDFFKRNNSFICEYEI